MAANNSFYAKRHKDKHNQLKREMARQNRDRKQAATVSHIFRTKVIVKQIGVAQ